MYIYIYIFLYLYIYIYIYIYTHTHTYIYTHIYTHTHVYIHTQIYIYILKQLAGATGLRAFRRFVRPLIQDVDVCGYTLRRQAWSDSVAGAGQSAKET